MTKVAYLDCPTGISGDMCLGALVDAGVPLDYLVDTLSRLGNAHEYTLQAKQVHHNGQQATKVQVQLKPDRPSAPAPATTDIGHTHASTHAHEHMQHTATRHLPEIEQMIQAAELPPRAEAWSLAVFRRLAEAEGAVHGIPPIAVHFHEVGAIDAIVDIVGTCLGLDWLDIEHLYCSALPTGGGTVRAAHGRLPVPAPAVLKLWEFRQIPIYSNGIERELVTPTGAAIATTLATQFGSPPAMRLLRVGLGAGTIALPLPNLLRLWIGETEQGQSSEVHVADQPTEVTSSASLETIAVLETQIDDLSPQAIGYVMERLLSIGALDVFTQAIGMKKSRPGLLLTVICRPEMVSACECLIFQETTTLGIRQTVQQRRALQRRIQSVQTPYGPVRVKVAWDAANGSTPEQPLNVQPEYEDCAAIARLQQVPLLEVHRLAAQHWQSARHSHK
jgi:uncharacterized protein (TIGR00299 family) protein